MADRAYLHVTGPVHIWARTPNVGAGPDQSPAGLSGVPFYVGTCERCPSDDVEVHYEPVMNDLGGPRVPFDREFQGAEGVVVLDLNRFVWNNLNELLKYPRYGENVAMGLTSRLDRGSLLLQNGLSYELWLQYSFYGTANATPGLPPGVYYPACCTVGNMKPKQGSTVMNRRLIVEPNNVWSAVDGSFMLESESPAYFAAIGGLTPG